ncbi:hypothetical protein TNIN_45911 [Trichonephila inaurata madagascariensis]|uniref:Uncharacterized protein n=1 Tax=Trichonephila inaurata madagascariensis TaxID=2747483 RepID=A0A8X6WNQ6_9ARAC|nr:hypothetical protein TNIN_45911 [Trichonephila inaurata madagascariensis]
MALLHPLKLGKFHVCDLGDMWTRAIMEQNQPYVAMSNNSFNSFCCQKSDNASLLLSRQILQCEYHVLTCTTAFVLECSFKEHLIPHAHAGAKHALVPIGDSFHIMSHYSLPSRQCKYVKRLRYYDVSYLFI